MARYSLVFKKSVAKDFRAIPKSHVGKILSRIESLAEDPRPPGSVKLTAQERYRVRQGAYRILYEIQDDELLITIVKVGHRKSAYT
ncbi:MAG TPA: type II toxin-antitoxin system RelE/ParE family toxin [Trueperaceae bacterium]